MIVSAIIPAYNRTDMLRQAVDSVIRQTYRPIEIIIVDDGSTDDTPLTIEQLCQEFPEIIRSRRQENAGPGAARELGRQIAEGEFIQYLDSDDLLMPKKCEKQVAALQADPDAGVCYGITLRRDYEKGELLSWARTAQKIENIFPEFLMKRGWDTNSPLWRRTVCDQIGPWGNFGVMEDWEHDLRAGMLGVKPVHVSEPLSIVRDHAENRASGMTTGFTPALTREFFRAHRSICEKMFERELLDWSYLEQFSRKIFWIARMCGERGLTDEADEALSFAERMVATHHAPREIRWFRLAVRTLGWRKAVQLSESSRKLIRHCRGTPRSEN